MKIFMVFLTMYFISMRIRNLKLDNVIRYMQCAQVMEDVLSIESEFSDHLIYRNFLSSHIS